VRDVSGDPDGRSRADDHSALFRQNNRICVMRSSGSLRARETTARGVYKRGYLCKTFFYHIAEQRTISSNALYIAHT
jgi:hypothetical protein